MYNKKRLDKNLKKIMPNGKTLILAYDQGLEHGPFKDFNNKNIDPLYIINIAKESKVNAMVFQKGIAEKYQKEIRSAKIPLIIKLNGKTSLYKGESISRKLCSVQEAINLGASAIGYTIYIGSKYESKMFAEFEKIEREAHEKNIPVIAWIYPRGKTIKNDTSKEMMAYATRTALETGADIVKIKLGKIEDLPFAVKSAGRTKVVIAGGLRINEKALLEKTKKIIAAGASGLAIGRNIWQSSRPITLAKKLKKTIK